MTNVLVINASINGSEGNSSKLTAEFLKQWQQKSQVNVVYQNLDPEIITQLSATEMQAWMTEAGERNEQQAELAAISDGFIKQLQDADVIVVGMPMYNYGVPSAFKAWIDRVARAGITFRYTETGPQGLLEDKKVYILAARGGMYAGTAKDSQTQYLKDVFAFIGMTDIEFVYAEGLAMGEEAATKAKMQASTRMQELLVTQLA